MDDAELVRRLREDDPLVAPIESGELMLLAADRIEALIAERDAARDAALEDAATKVERDQWPTFGDAHKIAAAIRALKGKSHE